MKITRKSYELLTIILLTRGSLTARVVVTFKVKCTELRCSSQNRDLKFFVTKVENCDRDDRDV